MKLMLREAVLYQYLFLATQVENESGDLRRPDPSDLQALLAAAVRHPYEWLGAPLAADAPDIDLALAIPRRTSQRLYPPPGAPSEWRSRNEWAAYADLQLNNGALCLQLAYACRGNAGDAVRQRLAAAPWSLRGDSAFLLGQTLCWGGRVPDLDAAIAAAELALPADPAQPWPLRRSDLPLDGDRAGWLFDRPGLPDRLAFFYPDDDEAEHIASAFFNAALPGLAVSLHKIAHQFGRGYEVGLHPLLAEKERSLAGVLASAVPPPQDAEGLDARLKELAGTYNEFAAGLASFDRLVQAVTVNVANVQVAFVEHALPRSGPLALRLTAAEQAVQQLQADRGFYQARVQQAQMALAALQVQTEIERNRIAEVETRQAERRNLLLGFIAVVLALGQITSDEMVLALWGWLLAFFGREPLDPMPAAITFALKLSLVLGASLLVVLLAAGLGRLWRRLRPPRP